MNKIRGFEVVKEEYRKNKGAEIKLPERGTKTAIAYDVFAPVDIIIPPFEMRMIWTDVKAYFLEDEALLANVRSSMGKHPIMLANTQGWIESDYYGNTGNDGNIGFNLFNLGKTDYIIKAGDRIGQLMFIKYLTSDNGNTNAVREGGFGSTGK